MAAGPWWPGPSARSPKPLQPHRWWHESQTRTGFEEMAGSTSLCELQPLHTTMPHFLQWCWCGEGTEGHAVHAQKNHDAPAGSHSVRAGRTRRLMVPNLVERQCMHSLVW